MSLDPKLSAACYRRDGWRCRYCGERSGLHPHHFIYASHQGPDRLDNLLTLCAACHRGHHDGKLKIILRKMLVDNLDVQFIPLKGWKPT